MRSICTFLLVVFIVAGVRPAENVELNPTNRNATFTWNLNTNDNSVGNRVYFSTNTSVMSSWSPLPDVYHPTNTITHSNLIFGLTYSYYVVAFDALGIESDPSNVIQFRPEKVNEGEPKILLLETAVSTETNVWDTFTLLSAPTNGVLTGTAPNFVYTSRDISGNTNSKDAFKYIILEGITNVKSVDSVTSWVEMIIIPNTNNLVYVGSRLEWWLPGNFENRNASNFNVKIFTNPPSPHFYREYLIITNAGAGITDLRVRLDWWKSLTNINTETIPLMKFTNSPVQFYRNFLIITNKPF